MADSTRWSLCEVTGVGGRPLYVESDRPLTPDGLAAAWEAAGASLGSMAAAAGPDGIMAVLSASPGFRVPVPSVSLRLGGQESLASALAAGIASTGFPRDPAAGPDPCLPLQVGPFLMEPNPTRTAWHYAGPRGWVLAYEPERDACGLPCGARIHVLAPGGHAVEDRSVASRAEAEDVFCGYRYRL